MANAVSRDRTHRNAERMKTGSRKKQNPAPSVKASIACAAMAAAGIVLSIIDNSLETGVAAENAAARSGLPSEYASEVKETPGSERTRQVYLNPLIRFENAKGFSCPVEGSVEEVSPSKVIEVPEGREAEWLDIGDLDNDGDLDLLTARNRNQAVTALTAYNRYGNVLWQWGHGGGAAITYDVPAQIYDIDGDGENEVLYSITGYLVVASGRDGAEEKRWPLPKELAVADCIIIANFSGKKSPSDILIKSRYDHVWAYDNNSSLLWEWGGNTGHHPYSEDVDGDGKDELFCGYTLLDDDGREMWHLMPEPAGHADTARVCWDLDGKSPNHPW